MIHYLRPSVHSRRHHYDDVPLSLAPASAKDRYLRAVAEERAARQAYTDALATEEYSRLRGDRPRSLTPFEDDFAYHPQPEDTDEYAWRDAAYERALRERIRKEEIAKLRERASVKDRWIKIAQAEAAREAEEEERRRIEQALAARAEAERKAVEAARLRAVEQERRRHAAAAAAEEERKKATAAAMAAKRKEAEDERRRAGNLAFAHMVRAAMDAFAAHHQEQATAEQAKAKQPDSKPAESLKKPSHRSLGRVTPEAAHTAESTKNGAALPAVAKETVEAKAAPEPKAMVDPIGAIANVEASFDNLRAAFAFPESLDFASVPTPTLAYSAKNAPVHAYKHALAELLGRLDAVESAGVLAVRDARRAVVLRVEGELEKVESRVTAVWKDMWEAVASAATVPTQEDEPAPQGDGESRDIPAEPLEDLVEVSATDIAALPSDDTAAIIGLPAVSAGEEPEDLDLVIRTDNLAVAEEELSDAFLASPVSAPAILVHSEHSPNSFDLSADPADRTTDVETPIAPDSAVAEVAVIGVREAVAIPDEYGEVLGDRENLLASPVPRQTVAATAATSAPAVGELPVIVEVDERPASPTEEANQGYEVL